MDIAIVSITAFLAAIITFFSGFGLGTLLSPVLFLFFSVDVAIGITGIVHLFNNLFKVLLVGRFADKQVMLQFGVPAVLSAILGAMLLHALADLPVFFSYTLFDNLFKVYPVKFIVAVLLLIFISIEILPYFAKLAFNKNKLPIGGVLSGFFGGLTGTQGALRSAFLIKAGLTKEAFVGTAAVVSTFVDVSRLSVYASKLNHTILTDNSALLFSATISAIVGAYIGHKLLKKITLKTVQIFTTAMLALLSLALGLGFI